MPDLTASIQSHDLGHLRIVASLWGVELTSVETDAALTEICAALLDPALVREILDALPAEACSALEALVTEGGRIPWATFARRFGQIREIGAGRRDREQPYLHPISAAETLFYRALLARAFFDTPSGAQEFAYLPDDLLPLIHHGEDINKDSVNSVLSVVKNEPLGRPASPKERARIISAEDRILDDACTLLAALRLGIQPPELSVPETVLIELLAAAKLIGDRSINPEAVKSFLEMPRVEALALLAKTWKDSPDFNELRQIPGLVCKGEWTNSSLITRHSLLDLLATIPHNQWWSLPAFIRAIKEKHPDFQRPAGDYDSWFIHRESDNTYLRGFEHWDEVDGVLIRYFISGPLHWLGMTDLASAEDGGIATAFRIKSKVEGQMSDFRLSTFDEKGKLTVTSDGKINLPRLVPRAARYQIARFCEWEDDRKDEYRYRVTTASLTRARQQKLKPEQLLAILRKHAAAPLPPPFVRAIQRWEINGTEARLEHPVVLRLASPAVLDELRKSKAGRFLGEILGPTTVIVKSGAQAKVLAALAEMGLLAEDQTSDVFAKHPAGA